MDSAWRPHSADRMPSLSGTFADAPFGLADIQCRAMRRLALVCACYLLISGIIFFPLIRDFNGVVAAGGDSYFLMWNMWWAHDGAHRPGQSLLWTGYQYHPTGASLLLQPMDLAQIAWSWPIYSMWGPIAANSAVVFIPFVLTGFCTFLLARKLGLTDGPAFVAGLIFMLCPFHFAHILGGHTSLASLHWLSLFCMAFIGWWRKPRPPLSVLLGLAFLALFYTNWYLTSCGFLLAISWSSVGVWQQPATMREKRRWLTILPALALVALGVGPILFPALLHGGEYEKPFGHVQFSADVLSFFVPGEVSAWSGLSSIWQRFTGNGSENGNYLGYATLVLAVVGLRFCRDRRFWIVVLLLALILSLGPYLHVAGHWEFSVASLGPLRAPAQWVERTARELNPSWCVTAGHVAVPLPYLFVKNIPLFSTARSPARFMALAFLALAIIAGFGIQQLLTKLGTRGRTIALVALVLLMVIEYYPRLSFVRPEADPFFARLAGASGDFAIVDCSEPWQRIYHQTIHGKRIVGGYVGREQIEAQRVLRESGMDAWMDGRLIERDIRQARNWLVSSGVRYVVVPARFEAVKSQIEKAGFPCVYRSDRIVVYGCGETET